MTSNNTLKDVCPNRVSAFLPNAPVGNDKMEAVLGMTSDMPSRVHRMILRSNGIPSRHYAIDPEGRRMTHTNAELAAEAVSSLFIQGVPTEAVGSLACTTSYPDQTMSEHGVIVHGLLDMPPCEVLSMADVCAAGMAAMKHTYNAVRTGERAYTVSVASENASAIMRGEMFQSETGHKRLENASPETGLEKDFLRWMLSDGAGAVYPSDHPNSDGLSLKIRWIDLLSYVNKVPPCMYAGAEFRDGIFEGWKHVNADYDRRHSLMAVKQDVKLLNENIVRRTVERPLSQIAAKHGIHAKGVDWFPPHYSPGFFRDRLSNGLKNIGSGIPQEKWFASLHSKGDTGSASVYIILEEFMRTFSIEHGQKVLCHVPESGRFPTCFMLLEAVETVQMKVGDTPQDNSASYHGRRKVIYDTHDGHYEAATSDGWQGEACATEMAVCELDAQTQVMREAVKKGECSPLYYHMFRYRYDEASLAMAAGVWEWRLRRHLRPKVFTELPAKTLQKYADACQINIDGLKQAGI